MSLTINAYQGSYVGLLAVDQSVLLLKGGNDITQNMVNLCFSISWLIIIVYMTLFKRVFKFIIFFKSVVQGFAL